jgi:hypothetical protein
MHISYNLIRSYLRNQLSSQRKCPSSYTLFLNRWLCSLVLVESFTRIFRLLLQGAGIQYIPSGDLNLYL